MTKLVTAVTLPNEGKRLKKFSFTGGTKHENGVFSDTRKAGAILVEERKDN